MKVAQQNLNDAYVKKGAKILLREARELTLTRKSGTSLYKNSKISTRYDSRLRPLMPTMLVTVLANKTE